MTEPNRPPQRVPQQPGPKGMDYVALAAVIGLALIAMFASWWGDPVVAGTAVGGIAGLVNRLYV